MIKLFLVVLLIGVVLVSGCINENTEPTGQIIKENIIEHEGSCRQNTDCVVASCSGELDFHCMNSIQAVTEVKCDSRLVIDKDHERCGCVEGVCMQIIK